MVRDENAMPQTPDHAARHILFITSNRIGDAVLSTGLLNHITQAYPKARVTIACGTLAVSLLEGFPQLERIIPLEKQSWNRHWLRLWRAVYARRWDVVIDLRNSAVSRLVMAKRRFIYGRHIDRSLHKVEQSAAVMGLLERSIPDSPAPLLPPAPKLWFTQTQLDFAARHIPDVTDTEGSAGSAEGATRVLAVGPTANWIGKTWPYERFIEIVEFLTARGGMMEGARVAVFAARGEEEAAYKVLNAVTPSARALDCIAKGTPGEAAAAIARCDFYIGNDSGLMHCAAAYGVPTLGLFGPSYPALYRPWGDHAHYIATPETIDELTAFEGYHPKTCGCLMNSLTITAVKQKLKEVLRA